MNLPVASTKAFASNNDRLMAVAQQCDIRKWRRVRDQLIAKGKVRVALDGRLTANRVESTLTEARSFAEVQANRARSRWEVGEKSGRSPGEKTENSIENSAANHAKMAMPPGNASTSTSTTTLESSLPSKGSNSAQSVVHNPDANGQVHVRIDSPHWKACSERYRKERGKDPPRDYAFGWHFPAEWIKKAGGTTK
jgi:hypothetical protein